MEAWRSLEHPRASFVMPGSSYGSPLRSLGRSCFRDTPSWPPLGGALQGLPSKGTSGSPARAGLAWLGLDFGLILHRFWLDFGLEIRFPTILIGFY